jgi:catechol 2,3-dioxygenase-like lactoylglutathione lyase family enzyme
MLLERIPARGRFTRTTPASAQFEEGAMTISAMNHFTILTDDLDATVAFYGEFLGLRPGTRPPFTFPGVWLYAEGSDHAILHVIAGRPRAELCKGVIDHNAFTGKGLAETVGRLQARGIPYELVRLPGVGTWQLFFHDPNGAKIEIDFDAAEPAPRAAKTPYAVGTVD